VLVGLYWTAVRVGNRLGLASTLFDATCCFANDLPGMGLWHKRTARELAACLRSTHLIEASLGMASLNALLPVDEECGVELNARDLLIERGRGHRVALVGHFAFTEAVRQAADRLWVLELQPTAGDIPATAAPEMLPQADVIGLTATTLMNGTFDELARLFPPQALVVMLGPSTPLSPVLFDYGVDVIAGARVTDPAAVWHAVAQASALHGKTAGLKRFTWVNGPL
jgi:uncharacterized protein (DUF4213/DUF364 family)